MWGTSSNYPSIRNYAQAARMYEHTKPLRGTTDVRPLDRRSRGAKCFIEKHGDVYSIRLYNTIIVSYEPDGSFWVNHGGWVSVSTAAAISAMSPVTAWRQRGALVVSAARYNYAGGNKFIVPSGGLRFNLGASGESEPANPPVAQATKKLVDKARAKRVREYYKPVVKYIETMGAFLAGTPVATAEDAAPAGCSLPESGVIDDERAAQLAVRSLYTTYTYGSGRMYVDNAKGSTTALWRTLYDIHGVYYEQTTDLPYGKV